MDNKEIKNKILDLTKEYAKNISSPKAWKEGDRVGYAGRVFGEDELVNLVSSSLDFWLTQGPYYDAFEKELEKYIGVKHALFVNSGSSANLLAFMTLTSPLLGDRKINPGDEVITVAAGFPTTVSPMVQYGAIPVFVDVDLRTYNIDCSYLEKALSKKTKAIMIAHTLGNPFNVALVKEFCNKNKLWLIEDNCDALGAMYKLDGSYHMTGTFGDIATSSFYPAHHMTTGEGGAVYTNDNLLHKIAMSMRDWGRDCVCPSGVDNTCHHRFDKQYGKLPLGYDHKYVYSHFGYNLKATDLGASIGLAQIKKLPDFVNKRIENFEYLFALLDEGGASEFLNLPEATKDSKPSWFGFLLTLNDNAKSSGKSRNAIVDYIESKNIQTRNLFAGNLTKHPCFESIWDDASKYRIIGDLKNTDKIMEDTFWLGVYPGLTKEMIEYMARVVLEAINN